MKGWTSLVLTTLVACGTGDDVADGTRGLCSEGGELNACADAPKTAWDACWRMVDCGASPVYEVDENQFDFDDCVENIDSLLESQQRLTIACIGAATCDQLRIRTFSCFLFGAN